LKTYGQNAFPDAFYMTAYHIECSLIPELLTQDSRFSAFFGAFWQFETGEGAHPNLSAFLNAHLCCARYGRSQN
jgi:hypothetical protein